MTHWYNIYIYIESHLHTHAHTIIYIYIMLDLSVSVGLWVDSAPPQPCHPCRRRAKVKLKPQIWRCHPGCMRCLKADDDVRFFCSMSFLQFPNFRMAWFLRFRSSNATEFMWFPCPFPLPKGYIIHTCIYYQGVVSIFLGVWRYSNQQVLCNQCSYIYIYV